MVYSDNFVQKRLICSKIWSDVSTQNHKYQIESGNNIICENNILVAKISFKSQR